MQVNKDIAMAKDKKKLRNTLGSGMAGNAADKILSRREQIEQAVANATYGNKVEDGHIIPGEDSNFIDKDKKK